MTKLILLAFFIQIIACKNTVKEPSADIIFNIDADNTQDVIDLKLSDLADSFRLVSLETTKECLLDNRTEFYIGKNYIIAFSNSGVYKFSADGKFIKKLFGLGRGPGEFTNLIVCIFIVDEKKDLLYINDQTRRGIYLRYDLNSDHFLEPVKQSIPAFGSFDIDNDSLIIVSNMLSTSNYTVFFQNFKGEFVSGITSTKKYISDQKEVSQKGRLIKADSMFYFYFHYDDTLFKLKENKLIPYLALNFNAPRDNPPKETLKNGDRFVNFQLGAPGFIIIHIDIIEDIKLYNRGTGGERGYYLLFNKFTGKASRINSYIDNFIGETKDDLKLSQVDFFNPFFLTLLPDRKLVAAYYQHQIKDAIGRGLNYEDFPDRINEQLLKLNENLQETDNPIILIGTIKDKI